jgi:NAD(P)H-hydrate epimerase
VDQIIPVAYARGSLSMIRLTRKQVREVDRIAIEEYGIPGIVLMENAARGVADAAVDMLRGVGTPNVLIVCGGGNNGGDGFAVARHLHNRGIGAYIVMAWTDEPRGDALVNLQIARAMNLGFEYWQDEEIFTIHFYDLTIDALFGTGLTRPITGDMAIVVELMNESKMPILAIDVPSGLDCDTGEPLGDACVRATKTATFVAEKAGFANPNSKQYTGDVIVADIGAPPEIVERVLREMPA